MKNLFTSYCTEEIGILELHSAMFQMLEIHVFNYLPVPVLEVVS